MKKLLNGSVLIIPLVNGMGFAYAKYLDLTRFKGRSIFPDAIKVFDYRTVAQTNDVERIARTRYLLEPIAVAGLRPTLREGFWTVIGYSELREDERVIPDFKGGNSTLDEIKKGDWFLHKEATTSNPIRCRYEEVKYLQPFAAISSANIELLLTMYHIINEDLKIADFFDLRDERNMWHYKQVLDSPALPV